MTTAGTPAPSPERVWRDLLGFLSKYGSVTPDTARGVAVEFDGRTSYVRLSQAQLHEYVVDYVQQRQQLGMTDGLVDGLPLPLTDSFGDCYGPQVAAYAEFTLEGLDLRPVTST